MLLTMLTLPGRGGGAWRIVWDGRLRSPCSGCAQRGAGGSKQRRIAQSLRRLGTRTSFIVGIASRLAASARRMAGKSRLDRQPFEMSEGLTGELSYSKGSSGAPHYFPALGSLTRVTGDASWSEDAMALWSAHAMSTCPPVPSGGTTQTSTGTTRSAFSRQYSYACASDVRTVGTTALATSPAHSYWERQYFDPLPAVFIAQQQQCSRRAASGLHTTLGTSRRDAVLIVISGPEGMIGAQPWTQRSRNLEFLKCTFPMSPIVHMS